MLTDRLQILVTVPECLDILLLSPTKVGQAWARRLEWIIFDEVHTINHPEEGPVWERILQVRWCVLIRLIRLILILPSAHHVSLPGALGHGWVPGALQEVAQ